jgi:hypothetical protein
MLTPSEEDPHRARHRDIIREASTPLAPQDASYVANTEIHDEEL